MSVPTASVWERRSWAAGVLFVVDRPRALHSLVLIGGVLLVALHGVSDIAIYGLLGGKLAAYGAQHDQGLSYTLYLLTFALDSVGDVFGSVFLIAAGLLVIQNRVLPRWLAWLSLIGGVLLFLQSFGLGGVIGTYGLVLDLIGFVSLLSLSKSSVVWAVTEVRRCGANRGTYICMADPGDGGPQFPKGDRAGRQPA